VSFVKGRREIESLLPGSNSTPASSVKWPKHRSQCSFCDHLADGRAPCLLVKLWATSVLQAIIQGLKY